VRARCSCSGRLADDRPMSRLRDSSPIIPRRSFGCGPDMLMLLSIQMSNMSDLSLCHIVQESMKWFKDDVWAWNGLQQPYRIKERHPDLVLIDPHLQVINCYRTHNVSDTCVSRCRHCIRSVILVCGVTTGYQSGFSAPGGRSSELCPPSESRNDIR